MIHVAIVGFGFMGITHAANVLRNKRLKLQAIVTRHPNDIDERLNAQTGNFSTGDVNLDDLRQVKRYTSLQECLRNETIDIVQLCVHTDLHFTLAMEAMEHGRHVFIEKPMSLVPDEARAMMQKAKEKNVKLMVGHVVRFMPPYVKLKSWIDNKTFGALKFISLTRFTGLPAWGQWKEKQQHFGSSGGALFDLVIHDIDFLFYALGEPEKINAQAYPGTLSMHDYVVAHWHYPEAHAKIEGGNLFHSAFPFQAGYMARFENASVQYASLRPEHIDIVTDEGIEKITAGDAGEGFYDEIDYFATCVEQNVEPTRCLPQSSLRTLELCYAHL
ncbi:Gfo/Idh/MocA family protein [Chryseolinea lacunae]|uniref:Gfo/Idh/MocA family oxidoreductase n=1 Tax=Chryseolinea lacunae TaxID=2801331 RepID=A0ABS1KJL1_9BACT|nr:Gfo/Idh/MocA family oxidoreductase [Chryseolinea lacunae]MBL0739646.1 Gfo/Idh/MocA family oxidoreductase [Chryseolinea lacunae]